MKSSKKENVFYIIHYIFYCLTLFFIGGGIGSLVIASITKDPLTLYGKICCYSAFPATVVRGIFQHFWKKELLEVKNEGDSLNDNNKKEHI